MKWLAIAFLRERQLTSAKAFMSLAPALIYSSADGTTIEVKNCAMIFRSSGGQFEIGVRTFFKREGAADVRLQFVQ